MKYIIESWEDMQQAFMEIRGMQTTSKPFIIEANYLEKNRTVPQNSAMWKYLTMLAIELNEAGWDMRKALKPSVEIPWNKDSAKRHLWEPIQEALELGHKSSKLSTTELTVVYDTLNRHTAQKFGISLPFPSKETI